MISLTGVIMSLSLALVISGDREVIREVTEINLKYNQYEYITDQEHFGKADYWQNPYEFSTYKKGDCEDYAIAKYYDLMNIGMPEDRLLVVYARHLPTNEAHMVLFVMIGTQWFVLDNMTDTIQPITKRKDLQYVYGFNTITNYDMRKAKWVEWELKDGPEIPVERLKKLVDK